MNSGEIYKFTKTPINVSKAARIFYKSFMGSYKNIDFYSKRLIDIIKPPDCLCKYKKAFNFYFFFFYFFFITRQFFNNIL